MDATTNAASNKQRFYFWLGFTATFLLLLLGLTLIWGVVKLILQFIDFLRSVDAQIAAQLIGTSGTILAAVIAVVIGQIYTKRRDIREAQRLAKTETYNAFVKNISDIMLDEENKDRNFRPFFKELTSRLMLSGSDDVIKEYNEWRDSSLDNIDNSILTLDKLLRALRKDLGHNNRKLSKGALIGLYLKPVERKKMFPNIK